MAIALAVAAADAAAAFAQATVPPAAVATAQPDDPSKAGDDKPKAETSGNPGDAKPEPEKPKGEEPKAETPAEPKAEVPKAEKPAEPKAEKPKPEKPAEPKAEKPKPAEPKAEKPDHDDGLAGAPNAKPKDAGAPPPAPQPPVEVAKAASPRPGAPGSADVASKVRRVAASHTAAHAGRNTAHPPAPARAHTPDTAGAAMIGRGVDDSPASRLASAAVAAPAAPSVDRLRPPAAILEASEPRYDATLVLAIAFAAGVGFLFGRKVLR